MTTAEPFRLFDVRIAALQRLSASFLRVTFSGDDLSAFADNGYDQRIKLVVPLPGNGLDGMPRGPGWHACWRSLPTSRRNPLRTYTVRAARPDVAEVDIDFVVHGGTGAAASWLAHVTRGDRAGLIGPNARYSGEHGGIEFRPPAGAALLLAGDETAVPAVAAILQRLCGAARGEVVLEVPHVDDVQRLAAPEGVRVTWGVRGHDARDAFLHDAVDAAADRLLGPAPAAACETAGCGLSADDAVLWDVSAGDGGGFYGWLAGEAAVVRALRRALVLQRGEPRGCVAAMGYWRRGVAEDVA